MRPPQFDCSKVTSWIFRGVALLLALESDAQPIDFNRQVRPILSDACFTCHGPDEKAREAKLRLDLREHALQPAKSGAVAIVPGEPERSELLLRVTDEHDAMPPKETGKRLTSVQVGILRQWISEGARYAPHWSFVPVAEPPLPAVADATWARNGIDRFVLARLEKEKLAPAPEALNATLLRRVSFDLTGLPPAPAELAAFLADTRPDAYERAVDRLLASPRFGERMAADWLDAARYADTNGFFRDAPRQIWPWRDWVIGAFNRNLSFDRFTIEQLAGDLLPDATPEQRIATGFNRNHMVSGETGIIDEEYRVEYVADQMETTSTVWMGLTVACARCHDHKYDPISQRDYYRLFAFFNSSVARGTITPDDPPPVMDVTSPEQAAELKRLTAARKDAETAFARVAEKLAPDIAAWEPGARQELAIARAGQRAHVDFTAETTETTKLADAHPLPRAEEKGGVYYEPGLVGQGARFDGMQHFELPASLDLAADRPWSIGFWLRSTAQLAGVFSKIEPGGDRRGVEVIWAKAGLQINLVDRWVVSAIELRTIERLKRGEWNHVILSYDGSRRAAGVRLFADGREVPLAIGRDTLAGSLTNREPVRIGRRDASLGFYGDLDEVHLFDRAIAPDEARHWYWSERLATVLSTAPEQRNREQRGLLADYFVERHAGAEPRDARQRLTRARESEENFRAKLPKTLVMQEVDQPKPTRLLKRGQYDAPGEIVTSAVPVALPPLPADAPRTRLGLARWLVSPEHPLTARVAVNRYWQLMFGTGLVATPNDFGLQGDYPTHPELLDWLAARFMQTGWDVKALLRVIVTSATYRQDSAPAAALLTRDPDNKLLARGPRFRLTAEMIRDQALAVSGLLVDRLGGPPVKPYQPAGLWEAVSFNGEFTYEADRDDGVWRRTVYSFWKRTAPPPGVGVLDGPTRETCTVSRPRTNTPLQALLLLNDDTFVEAARALAAHVLGAHATTDERVEALFRRATARAPDAQEQAALRGLIERQRARFAADRGSAERLVAIGLSPVGRERDPGELAAWMTAAQIVLNLDETITRR